MDKGAMCGCNDPRSVLRTMYNVRSTGALDSCLSTTLRLVTLREKSHLYTLSRFFLSTQQQIAMSPALKQLAATFRESAGAATAKQRQNLRALNSVGRR